MTAEPLVLPPAAMEAVFNFLDPSDLAHMAMTCSVWRKIVYRKSVWERHCLVYNDAPHVLHTNVPAGARHNGSPSKACFLSWFVSQMHEKLPLSILRAESPEVYIRSAWKYWKRNRCPCVIRNHHNVYDLLKIPFPSSLSKTDQRRILCRLLILPTSPTRNAYSFYVDRQRYTVPSISIPSLVEEDKDSSDPCHRYLYAANLVNRARLEKLNRLIQIFHACCTASSYKLQCRGSHEFDNNDTWYKHDQTAAWEAASFSYKKSSA